MLQKTEEWIWKHVVNFENRNKRIVVLGWLFSLPVCSVGQHSSFLFTAPGVYYSSPLETSFLCFLIQKSENWLQKAIDQFLPMRVEV